MIQIVFNLVWIFLEVQYKRTCNGFSLFFIFLNFSMHLPSSLNSRLLKRIIYEYIFHFIIYKEQKLLLFKQIEIFWLFLNVELIDQKLNNVWCCCVHVNLKSELIEKFLFKYYLYKVIIYPNFSWIIAHNKKRRIYFSLCKATFLQGSLHCKKVY